MALGPTPIYPGDTIVFIPDSRTAKLWYLGCDGVLFGDPTQNLIGLLNRDFAYPHVARTVGTSRGRVVGSNFSRTVPVTDKHRQVTAINSGVSGNTIEDLSSSVASRITSLLPADPTKHVVIQLGYVNNVDGASIAWNPATFTTQYQSIQDQLKTFNPLLRYIGTDSIVAGESYTVSPPAMGPNAGSHDPDLETQAGIMAGILAAMGQQFVRIRPLLVPWEIINNPNNDASGHLLKVGDGLHFSVLGATQLCQWTYAAIKTVP